MKFFYYQPVRIINSKNRKTTNLFLLLLLFISVATYIFQPVSANVSMPLFYGIVAIMIVSNVIYFKTKKKLNYLDFDTIFISIYCLVGFSTTFFYNNDNLYKALFLGFPVSDSYVNRGNLLFLVGLQSYMLGSLSIPNFIKKVNKNTNKIINTTFVSIFLLLLIILFITSGGISFYRTVYTRGVEAAEAGIVMYVLLLIVCTGIVMIATELYNKKILPSYRISKISLLSVFLLVLLLLWAGNRTAASMLVLPFLCIFGMYFHNVRFKQFILFIFFSILAMWVVQNTRSNTRINFSEPVLLILDLTIPARQTYTVIEYVELNGYTYGKSMSLGVIGLVPFLASTVTRGDIKEFGSGETLTEYTHNKNNTPQKNRIGLGTTIIADLYLAFGLLGVILFMFLLGYFISKLLLSSAGLHYYFLVALTAMLANCVFMVRASYTHPVRYMVWALILAYINKLFINSFKKKSYLY